MSQANPTQPGSDDGWMTLAEAAAYLRVKPTTLYKWCDEGRLRYYELKTGRGRRFKRVDLDELLEVREPRRPPDDPPVSGERGRRPSGSDA